jgi:chromosome segregation protein
MQAALAAAQDAVQADRDALRELADRLAAAQAEPEDQPVRSDERDALAVVASGTRQAEVEVRLAVRTGEERARALGARAESLERGAAEERSARERAVQRRERRVRELAVAAAVARGVAVALARLEQSLQAAAAERAAAERDRTDADAELASVRSRVRELAADLDELTGSVHRDEMARTEQRLRIEAVQTKALEEHGVDEQTLLAEYGPDQLVPPSQPVPPEGEGPAGDTEGSPHAGRPGRGDDAAGTPVPYVRAEQEKRLRSAERALATLGRVNPLALEEYAALEERHAFLTEQLEDLKKTGRDLMDIVHEVDERVEQVFTAAYHDTAREFETVFARLFPGGEGRLVLTDPGDMLATGIEVEARPPGKKVKRLSLLSGGERSLVAVALLLAIFKARPSPFYVMDEVEAALDDTNLGRLLALLEELRESSQLIVITHQKRTMEIADALYGVSMRGDGVTGVISQRLRQEQPA